MSIHRFNLTAVTFTKGIENEREKLTCAVNGRSTDSLQSQLRWMPDGRETEMSQQFTASGRFSRSATE